MFFSRLFGFSRPDVLPGDLSESGRRRIERGSYPGIDVVTGLRGFRDTLNGSEFHPSLALASINHSLDFMGHGASKWTCEERQFAEMLIRLEDAGSHGKVRLLLLNPASDACLDTSAKLFPEDPLHWPRKIVQSLFVARGVMEHHNNLEITIYDHKPVFRLTIIDGRLAIVGHYRNYHQDSDASPLLIFEEGPEWSFSRPFQQLFDTEWKAGRPPDWDAIESQAGELGVASVGTRHL
jgi:hypothetical protein